LLLRAPYLRGLVFICCGNSILSFIRYIMKLRIYILLVIVSYAMSSLSAAAQAGRAELFGVILDASGLPIPGAAVQAEDQATMVRYSGTSDERGEYHLVGLPAGNYVVTVEQPGFRMYRQSGITLRLAERVALDIPLQVGQTSQTVEVTASTPLLQTSSGEV